MLKTPLSDIQNYKNVINLIKKNIAYMRLLKKNNFKKKKLIYKKAYIDTKRFIIHIKKLMNFIIIFLKVYVFE